MTFVALLSSLSYVLANDDEEEMSSLDDIGYGSKVNFECKENSFINRIRSYHGGKDRKWAFGCTEAPGKLP